MTSLLHLDSSANTSGESVSRQLTASFADTWRDLHGSDGYRYRDLVADPVPPLDTAYCALGRRLGQHGLVPPAEVAALLESPAEEQQWALTYPLVTELLAAETVLIGAPMYNYSVSASLKAWIDRVTFPGAFTDPDTGDSLLRETSVVVITPRGGAYGQGTPRETWDFHTPYLRTYLRGLGVSEENLCFVSAELTLSGLVQHLGHLQPLAARSLAEARVRVAALCGGSATERWPARGRTAAPSPSTTR